MIEPNTDLRSQFGQYYSFFTESDPDAPAITTVPYIDYFALGKSQKQLRISPTVEQLIECLFVLIRSCVQHLSSGRDVIR